MHCLKSVQIRSYFWSVFSCIRIEYGDLRIFVFNPNTGKYNFVWFKQNEKKTDFVIYQNKVLGRYKRQNENSKKSLIKFSYGYLRTIAKDHNAKKMLITSSLDAIYIAVIHKSVLDIRAKSSHTQH